MIPLDDERPGVLKTRLGEWAHQSWLHLARRRRTPQERDSLPTGIQKFYRDVERLRRARQRTSHGDLSLGGLKPVPLGSTQCPVVPTSIQERGAADGIRTRDPLLGKEVGLSAVLASSRP